MRRHKLLFQLALALTSVVLCLGLAELLYRGFGPRPGADGEGYYADANHLAFDLDDPQDRERAAPMLELVDGAPRFRLTFKPGTLVHLCYEGRDGVEGFDAHGCVPMQMNACGIREREFACEPKPAGERRIVCVGDSMTVGWGVRVEDGWVRRVETELRRDEPKLRTVNCGAAGALCPDEYLHALRERFWRFEPDLVLVTLCLNDLLPVNGGMSHLQPELRGRQPAFWEASALLRDLGRALGANDPRALDPARDWVGELLELAEPDFPPWARDMGVFESKPGSKKPQLVQGTARAVFWGGGGPQRALLAMRDLCRERGARFGVAMWPFLQGLGDGEFYPFTRMHELVAAFCAEQDIPFLDLLPSLRGHDPRSLWVTPADMHANAHGHALATPAIARFVAGLLED